MNQRQLQEFIKDTNWSNIVWATDLDGTLFDFQDKPEDVKATPALVQNLQTLNSLTDGHFYIVTGRDMGFVDSALYPFVANISAEHHCQLRINNQTSQLVSIPEWTKVEQAFNAASELASGIWIEGKTFSRTIHYRGVSALDQALENKLATIATGIADTYNASVGDPTLGVKFGAKAIEIGPHAQDKGEAIDIIMALPGNNGKTPIYWGDSEADRPAGERAKALGGLYIGVGPHPGLQDIADIHFDTPEQARASIAKICAQYGNGPVLNPSATPP